MFAIFFCGANFSLFFAPYQPINHHHHHHHYHLSFPKSSPRVIRHRIYHPSSPFISCSRRRMKTNEKRKGRVRTRVKETKRADERIVNPSKVGRGEIRSVERSPSIYRRRLTVGSDSTPWNDHRRIRTVPLSLSSLLSFASLFSRTDSEIRRCPYNYDGRWERNMKSRIFVCFVAKG